LRLFVMFVSLSVPALHQTSHTGRDQSGKELIRFSRSLGQRSTVTLHKFRLVLQLWSILFITLARTNMVLLIATPGESRTITVQRTKVFV